MDIFLSTSVEKFSKILESLGFKITKKRKYYCAILNKCDGRIHAPFCKLKDKIYCDLHFDLKIHFMFMGVDFKIIPKMFFDKKIKTLLKSHRIKFKVKETCYLKRKNKAIFKGFRV